MQWQMPVGRRQRCYSETCLCREQPCPMEPTLSQRAQVRAASSSHRALQRLQEPITAARVAGPQRVWLEASTMAARARKIVMCWKTRSTLWLRLVLRIAQLGLSAPACEVLPRRLLQLPVHLPLQGQQACMTATAVHHSVAAVVATVRVRPRRCCTHFLLGICKRSKPMQAVEAQAAMAEAAQYPLARRLAVGEPVQFSAVVLLLMAAHTLMGMHLALRVVAWTCAWLRF